jgi:peptidyl-dipeptidase Dcp
LFGHGLFVAAQWVLWLLDMMLFTQSPPTSIQEMDEKILDHANRLSVFPRGSQYKMYTAFHHIFESDGYAAWYYSYIRAEIIEAQVFDVFQEYGMFDKSIGKKFLDTILAAWCTDKAEKLLYDFTGEWVNKDAYMKRYALG